MFEKIERTKSRKRKIHTTSDNKTLFFIYINVGTLALITRCVYVSVCVYIFSNVTIK